MVTTTAGAAIMAKAVWKNTVLAGSETFEVVEGNIYFPENASNREYFAESDHRSNCLWKGIAKYYSVTVAGEENANAAWCYPDPKPAAAKMRRDVAFWRGVEVSQ